MDRERLSDLLQHPVQVADGDLESLRTMAERFPWFSGARLLLAVGEQRTGNMLAREGHSDPAAHLPSRQVLFDLVHTATPAPAPTLRAVKAEPPAAALTQVPHIPDPQPTSPALALAPQDQEVPPAEVHPTPGLADPGMQPFGIEPVELHAVLHQATTAPHEPPALAPESPSSMAELEQDYFDRLFLEATTNSHYHLGPVPTPASIPTPVETITVPPEPESSSALNDMVPLPTVPEPIAPLLEAVSVPSAPVRLRFTDWLEQPGTTPPVPPLLASPHAPAPKVAQFRVADPTPAAAKDKTVPASQHEIMDRFIQQASPPAPVEKAVFFNPQKAAKRSLQDDGMVSETLARIHEKQGNFAKAREVYDRLAAKHPEKSVYFAALSKALEGRSNK